MKFSTETERQALQDLVVDKGNGETTIALKRLLAEAKLGRDFVTELTSVMPVDFTDWQRTSILARPELAALLITNLRKEHDAVYVELARVLGI